MDTSRRAVRRWTVPALVLGGGLLFYFGDQRHAVPAAAGASFRGATAATPAPKNSLRVATFNIHGGTGRDLRRDLARTASAVRGFDLVLLNEVHGPYFWQAAGQAEQLAAATGCRWLFAPTETRWWHHQFGNAVLSVADVAWWQRLPLPSASRGYRNLVLMSVPFGRTSINVVATHLDRNDAQARDEQLRTARELFLALAEPAMLMGDLNTTADEPHLAALLKHEDVRDPLGDILGRDTPRRIDWILTRGLRTIDAGTLDNGASDHPLIWAEVALPEGQVVE